MSVGLVGLPLLLVGLFKPYLVLPGAIVVWLVLVRLRHGARAPASGRVSLTTHAISGAAAIVAVIDFLVNAKESTQHLLADGDPAIYGLTGKWIASHGTLNIAIHPEWFGHDQTINYMTNGFFLRPDGNHLYPQFFHLLPALLAVGDWFDGTRGLLHLNMAIGGFAVLAVYAFATRLMRPIWALAATVTLSMTLPQVFFSRDTFSEIPSQLLVFAGLALLYDTFGTRCKRPGSYGFLAALTLGGSTMVRIDAFAYIPPTLAAIVVLALVVAKDDERRAARVRVAIGVAAGFVLTCAVAVADAVFGSPEYAKSVTGQLVALSALTLVVVAIGALLLTRPRIEHFAVRLSGLFPRLARPVGLVIVVGLGLAWLVRPYVQKVHETGVLDISSTIANLQKAEHVAIDPTRHYNEMSLRWLSWYIGPVTMTLAILGFGYLACRVLRGRDQRLLPFLLVAGSVTAIYIYDPQIVPVQYWATRRFVPVSLPALCLLAFFVLHRVVEPIATSWVVRRRGGDARSSRIPAPLRAGAAGLAVVLGVISLITPAVLMSGSAVRLVHAYIPVRDSVAKLCAALQPSDTVLLVGGGQTNGFVQTIEIYCGNSAAVSGQNTKRADIIAMANAAKASGHRLMLVSTSKQPVDSGKVPLGMTLPDMIYNAVFDTEALSLTHRPNTDFKVALPIYIGPAPLS